MSKRKRKERERQILTATLESLSELLDNASNEELFPTIEIPEGQVTGDLELEIIETDSVANGTARVEGKEFDVLLLKEDYVAAGLKLSYEDPEYSGRASFRLVQQDEIKVIGTTILRVVDLKPVADDTSE